MSTKGLPIYGTGKFTERMFAKEEKASLRRIIESMKITIKEKDSMIEILIKQNQSLFESNSKTYDFYQNIYVENELLYERIADMDVKEKESQTKIEQLEKELERLKKNIQSSGSSERVRKLENKNYRLNSLLVEARDRLTQNEKDINELNLSLDTIESNYEVVRKSRSESINQSTQLLQENIRLKNENELLNEELLDLRDKYLVKSRSVTFNEMRGDKSTLRSVKLSPTQIMADSFQTSPLSESLQLTPYNYSTGQDYQSSEPKHQIETYSSPDTSMDSFSPINNQVLKNHDQPRHLR
ncbi:hypothetical protein WICPIJ_007514 [Wickerhamomyces pijperi]|uniref:Uncharacterized protein n=1 Tax=Wickerhamomyces pijperi TaxID=599730 RepID=A0A9P8Q045_WICPI|nr:hypothetical protein WICPIJ_007514 [Wickerhamomyces pijperi]